MRVALVTGGAHRIGRAIVEELCGAGWAVAFSYRASHQQATALKVSLQAAGREVLALAADLDEPASRAALVDTVVARLGGLDALVNNAAVFPRTPIGELSEETLRATLRTNLEAPLFLALAAAPHLRSRRGSVVNIADIHAELPLRHYLAYTVSKAALVAATRGLAVELAPEVRVNAVAPGAALFPETYDDGKRQRILDRTLLGREGSAEEIARAVRFLLETAETVTGQVLNVDGGRSIAG